MKKMYWYNFKTKESNNIETPEEFEDYIPQSPAAQNLYNIYREIGNSRIKSAEMVLRIGKK